MYMIAAISLFVSAFLIDGEAYTFVAMMVASALFGIADSIVALTNAVNRHKK